MRKGARVGIAMREKGVVLVWRRGRAGGGTRTNNGRTLVPVSSLETTLVDLVGTYVCFIMSGTPREK
jgi:hypothetical protein